MAYQSRSLPYLSTLHPQFWHVHPPHQASRNEVALRAIGKGSAQRAQTAPNIPMPRLCDVLCIQRSPPPPFPAAVISDGVQRLSMSRRNEITGRDTYIIVEALTFAVEALSKLPIEFRPDNNIEDMKRLIDARVKQDATLGQAQQIAQRRLAMLLEHLGRQERT
jgi:hypothetical protein